ncbi:uncharacterized protein EV422DRAFT_506504 [Fimicolochytrium jonesii]|uniref:uncharacterized protein n=1 Tax=Fimicolochytrium jonesii TaxID=1396493 RepID=UPI0022FEB0C0|nr:uncharacterized protein EV422DRAFT_506504 [Fimicolochytrium jonesii]KAI8820774.1 hypothetical protein EV422DRAFT_506504 [Fimicolochytrium jonesii]
MQRMRDWASDEFIIHFAADQDAFARIVEAGSETILSGWPEILEAFVTHTYDGASLEVIKTGNATDNPEPWPLMETCKVAKVSIDDPRTKLRGRDKVVAIRAVKKNEIIGVVEGRTQFDKEFRELCHLRVDTVEAKGSFNWVSELNDYRNDVSNALEDLNPDNNVALVEAVIHGWPYIFVKATAQIETGDELLLDYGADYWESLCKINVDDDQVNGLVDEAVKPFAETIFGIAMALRRLSARQAELGELITNKEKDEIRRDLTGIREVISPLMNARSISEGLKSVANTAEGRREWIAKMTQAAEPLEDHAAPVNHVSAPSNADEVGDSSAATALQLLEAGSSAHNPPSVIPPAGSADDANSLAETTGGVENPPAKSAPSPLHNGSVLVQSVPSKRSAKLVSPPIGPPPPEKRTSRLVDCPASPPSSIAESGHRPPAKSAAPPSQIDTVQTMSPTVSMVEEGDALSASPPIDREAVPRQNGGVQVIDLTTLLTEDTERANPPENTAPLPPKGSASLDDVSNLGPAGDLQTGLVPSLPHCRQAPNGLRNHRDEAGWGFLPPCSAQVRRSQRSTMNLHQIILRYTPPKAGDTVLACWQGNNVFYEAKVIRNTPKTYRVKFLDVEEPAEVSVSGLVIFPDPVEFVSIPAPNSKCLARMPRSIYEHDNSGQFLPATITGSTVSSVDVRFSFGVNTGVPVERKIARENVVLIDQEYHDKVVKNMRIAREKANKGMPAKKSRNAREDGLDTRELRNNQEGSERSRSKHRPIDKDPRPTSSHSQRSTPSEPRRGQLDSWRPIDLRSPPPTSSWQPIQPRRISLDLESPTVRAPRRPQASGSRPIGSGPSEGAVQIKPNEEHTEGGKASG